jgi:UDP-glucose 4-epimerase
MRDAICSAFEKNIPGVYNVAPDDYIGFQDAIKAAGSKTLQIPSVPPAFTERIARFLKWKSFPPYLINYFKYPVIIDGSLFAKTFGFKPKKTLNDIFTYYKSLK